MKFGIQVSCYLTTWDAMRAVVEAMEKGRWHSVYLADHFVPPNRPAAMERETAFEGLSTMAAIASITDRMRLGHLVLGNTYRNPGHVAKIAGSIDHISHGRFTLSIGAGWFRREHEAYGWDFPSLRERSDRLEEAANLIRQLFTSDEPVNFQGRYYSLDNAVLSPGSVQEPHIPIMIGGMGERRTLRTLAMYGDVFNVDGFAARNYGGMSLDLYTRKLDTLNRHCERVGRDPAEIRPTVLMPARLTDDEAEAEEFVEAIGPGTVAGSASYIIHRIGELVDAGADEIMFGRIPNEPEYVQRFEEEVLTAFD